MSATVKSDRGKLIATIIAIVIALGAAAAFYISATRAEAQAETDRLAVEAQERTELAIQAYDADQEFFKQAEQQVKEAQEAERAEQLAAAKEQRDAQVSAAQEVLSSSQGKVLDETVREQLLASIEEAENSSYIRAIRTAVEAMVKKIAATEQAVEEWETEQARLVEEARLAEEARQAEAARQAEDARRAAAQQSSKSSEPAASTTSRSSNSSSANANSTNSNRSNGSSSSGGGKTERAKSILARHGCSDLSVKWDDPRLNGWSGMYPPGEGTILLHSRNANTSRLPYIVAHECAHHLQHKIYNFDQWQMKDDMNAIYGTSGLNGIEHNADCITQRWGYSEHHYTTNCSGDRGTAAKAIVNGRKP